MSTKEALEALIGGQAFEFRSKIENELAARSLEAIQTKRFEVGASMFGGEVVEEEVEDLEEVSLRKAVRTYASRTSDAIDGDDEAGVKSSKTYDRIEKKWGDKGTKLADRGANRKYFGTSHGIMAHYPEKRLETKSEKKRNDALRNKADDEHEKLRKAREAEKKKKRGS